MRFIITTILVININLGLFAQTANNTESKDSTNIYFQSLKKYCEYIKSLNTDKTTLLIEENHIVTRSIPSRIGEFEIRVVYYDRLKKEAKKEGGIELINIIPLRVKEGEFFINIISFRVKYSKRNFDFINIGGESIIYMYDEGSKTFQFKEIRHGNL